MPPAEDQGEPPDEGDSETDEEADEKAEDERELREAEDALAEARSSLLLWQRRAAFLNSLLNNPEYLAALQAAIDIAEGLPERRLRRFRYMPPGQTSAGFFDPGVYPVIDDLEQAENDVNDCESDFLLKWGKLRTLQDAK